MSETKHTPGDGFPWGPWTSEDERPRLNLQVTVNRAAWGDPNMTERFNRHARAQQLAIAAPDLLAACEAALRELRRLRAEDGSVTFDVDVDADGVLVAAIAAAKGGAR
ncbi:MAG: hypothetical protein ACK52I_01500 [Pseudomonadota bacterium]